MASESHRGFWMLSPLTDTSIAPPYQQQRVMSHCVGLSLLNTIPTKHTLCTPTTVGHELESEQVSLPGRDSCTGLQLTIYQIRRPAQHQKRWFEMIERSEKQVISFAVAIGLWWPKVIGGLHSL